MPVYCQVGRETIEQVGFMVRGDLSLLARVQEQIIFPIVKQ